MNLTLDIGNTFAKVAIFDPSGSMAEVFLRIKLENLDAILDGYDVSASIICSVGKPAKPWVDRIKQLNSEPLYILDYKLPVPVSNSYSTPDTLGMDRLASVIGGTKLYPNSDILVIDAGSCITYDYLKSGSYQGGAIAPGLEMKLKALHNFTSKLPLVPLSDSTDLIGTSTDSSILSGVLNGTLAEINGTIEEYKRISNNLAVILCGGDAELLGKLLKNVDTVESGLVFIGLNQILEHNVKKNK